MKKKASYDIISNKKKSVSQIQSLVQQKLAIYESYFQDFVSNNDTQNLKYIFKVLSQDRVPTQISCRDQQKKHIQNFILQSIKGNQKNKILCIGGAPGTGKTLCVKNTVQDIRKNALFQYSNTKFIYQNAMKIKEPKDIFKSILCHLTDSHVKLDSVKSCFTLNNYFQKGIKGNQIKVSQNNTKILVIDEIDYLRTEQQQVIYNLVQWTRCEKSNLYIIGISNTVDLPLLFSPKITKYFGKDSLIFSQYTSEQIGQIINQRLQQCQGVFSKEAIQYICNKIAAQQTDIRKCLHILRESINKHLGKDKFINKPSKVYVANIPVYVVQSVIKQLFYDSFVNTFSKFPLPYKIVLVCMAYYFRQQSQSLAYSHLEYILGEAIIYKPGQLRAILFDLKDLGLITIKYLILRNDHRVNKSFNLTSNIQEQFINLIVDVDKIMVAYQPEEQWNQNKHLSNQLEKWKNYFTKKN